MSLKAYILVAIIIFRIKQTSSIRLNKLFQFIDGYRSEHKLRGYLHVGNEYSVFLHIPKPHDKFLTYELYESGNADDLTYKPVLLAVSKVPVAYIKEQLKIFRKELYKAKYVDDNFVPGTEVLTLREWQINRALNFHGSDGFMVNDRPSILRTIV